MKKILMSVMVIAVTIGVVATGLSGAWFSDTESTAGNPGSPGANILTAGSIDLTMERTVTIDDLKPCVMQWGYILLHNAGENDGNAWLHFTNVMNAENDTTDAEVEAYWEMSGRKPDALRFDNDLERFMTVDVYIDPNIDSVASGGRYIITQDDHRKLADLECQWIPLGLLEEGVSYELWFSFHIQPEAGNQYQTDQITFDIEVMLLQTNADPPSPKYPSNMRVLRLENKVVCSPPAVGDAPLPGCWDPIIEPGSTYGILTFDWYEPTFDYTFEAYGLNPLAEYKLIYYADPFPGNHLGALLGTFTTDGSGNIVPFYYSLNLGHDLPTPSDANHPDGAKIWLVPSSDYVAGAVTWANPSKYLYEMRLITYQDTDA